ncbi:MAG: site-specific integrase, partial [Armatimonadetes bacterium]|nr:site-specific integrase [Armatimonadota bacterium]
MSKPLPEAFLQQADGFVEFLAVERARSDNTIAAYRRDLDDYARFLSRRGRGSFTEATSEDVREYMTFLQKDMRRSRTTAARRLSAMRMLHRYLLR